MSESSQVVENSVLDCADSLATVGPGASQIAGAETAVEKSQKWVTHVLHAQFSEREAHCVGGHGAVRQQEALSSPLPLPHGYEPGL